MKTFKVKIRKVKLNTEVDKDGHGDSFNEAMYARGIKIATRMGRNLHWYVLVPHKRGIYDGIEFNYHESWLIFVSDSQ